MDKDSRDNLTGKQAYGYAVGVATRRGHDAASSITTNMRESIFGLRSGSSEKPTEQRLSQTGIAVAGHGVFPIDRMPPLTHANGSGRMQSS